GFGASVAISGRTIVASNRRDFENENNTGSAYVFKISNGVDCNGNGICDVVDFVDGVSQDCNLNDIPDECDIANGTSSDRDNNGIPDECALQCSLISFDLGYDGELKENSAGLEVVINDDIAAVLQDTGEQLEIQFFHQADGVWALEATRVLAGPFTTQSWYPRKSLDISGSTIIAGTFTNYWNGFAIFNRKDGEWIEEASVSQYTEELDQTYFALSVSISEDVAVVGRPNTNGDVHSAIVYRRMGNTWFQEAILTNPFDPTDQWFGTEVAVDGNTIMVTGLSSPVTVYEHDGSSWNPIQYIENNGIPFSSTIDVQGDVAFVGTFAGDYKDRVQVLNRVDGQWELGQSLTPIDPNDFGFGYAVRLDGDRAIVTSGLNYFGDPELGKVHVFQLENGQWTEIETLQRPDLPGSWLNSPRISLSENQIAVAYVDDGSTGFSEVTLFNVNSDDDADDIDCNGNTYCDALDISLGISRDCDGNGIPDECDIADGLYIDVDLDGLLDICEADCDNDLFPDDYELEQGQELDCNGNGIPDSCDITFGQSPDFNGDGIPDECDPNFMVTVAADGSGLFTDIQPAIDLAMPGSTISVAPGVYSGTLVLPGHDIQLISESGPESTLIIASTGLPTMVIGNGHGAGTLINGFTLTGADVTGSGGGLVVSRSTPTIMNCIVTGNQANRGGGIHVSDAAPLIEACQIIDNQARSGGGIAIDGIDQTAQSVRIIECRIANNTATEDSFGATNRGGAGLTSYEGSVVVQATEITDNHAAIWGGGFECVKTTSLFSECVFASNTAGIASANLGASFLESETSLQNCTLCNQQLSEINGGWLDLGGNIELENCECPDTNGDGLVDVNDILAVIDAWGDCVPDQDCPADVDGDDVVNVNDVLLVIGEWGACE
ncbi:MAG: hypothetical protein CMJ29_11235, partial [Phycisphaerae bacterium]|nr:hypothetical protein [Phycisphaerae bacterium]